MSATSASWARPTLTRKGLRGLKGQLSCQGLKGLRDFFTFEGLKVVVNIDIVKFSMKYG